MRYKQGEVFYPFLREPNSTVSSVDMYIIRDDGFILDWDDLTFYDSGWTTKEQALVEKTEGIWVWATGWTIPAADRTYFILYKTNKGYYYRDDRGPIVVGNLNDISAAQVNTQVDMALTDYDSPTKTEMDAAHALLATAAGMNRLLGLSYENTYQHTRVYSGGKLTSAKMDLYNSKANAQTHDGTTGIVAKYTLTFTYSGDELDTMQVLRDS